MQIATSPLFQECSKMAMTVRLVPGLEAEALAYAKSIGLSANDLVAVALREYLDARPAPAVPVDLPPARVPTTSAPAGKLSPADRLKLKAQSQRAGGGK